MKILVTRPKHDKANHYLYYWTQEIVDLGRKKLASVFDLEKEKSSRKNVQSYIKKGVADIILLNGHGDDSSVFGHNNEEILSTGDDLSNLRGKIIFIRACRAAVTLGPTMIKEGAKSVIAYKEDFNFFHKKDMLHRPLEDSYARPFFECSNQVAISLVKGHTAKEANEMSRVKYEKEIAQSLNSEKESSFLPFLMQNMQNQVCLE